MNANVASCTDSVALLVHSASDKRQVQKNHVLGMYSRCLSPHLTPNKQNTNGNLRPSNGERQTRGSAHTFSIRPGKKPSVVVRTIRPFRVLGQD
jgi:hypothetical protein